jgi:N4-gp56 family major capsid protein
MATTDYPVNHPLAVKLWAKKLMQEALKQTYFAKFIGKGSGALIQLKEETSKSAGDRITFGLRMQLTGDGVVGDGTLEGNEESLVTYSDNLLINQIRNAVKSDGKMSEQRVPFSVREEARMGLTDWFADMWDTAFFNQLCGNTAVATGGKTGNNATVAPTTTRTQFSDGKTTEAGIASTGASTQMRLTLIDYAVEKAKTATPFIRPVKVGADDMYVCFLHPYQVTQLRTTTDTGQWLDIQKAAMTGGKISDNPIFTGALGVYNNVILHESTRIPVSPTQSTVRRAVLCGAQAAVIAFGQDFGSGESGSNFKWTEKLFDYENQLGVSAASIYGLKKTIFNSVEFATIVIPTQSIAAA